MNNFFFQGLSHGVYSSPMDVPGGSIHDKTALTQSTHGVIYDIYDALLRDHPKRVTKEVIGEAHGCEIRRYTFKNYEMPNFTSTPATPFKVAIVAAIHGYEQGSAWTLAHFFRLLLTSKDEKLAFLRRNIVFDVIPVANPWGFDHNDRKNKNEVDLNRNFAPFFCADKEKSSAEYAGEAPESEAETKALMKFIEENTDAQVVIDYHNIARGNPLFYVYGQRDIDLANAVFSALTDKWKEEYPALPEDEILGRVRPNGGAGMFADHAIDKGLWVLTMEAPWCMPVIGKEQYDAPTIRIALDVLVNTLLAIARS